MQRPTVCIFEDAHWLDPSTLELIELIISRIGHARVLLIVSCRPEFRPTWLAHANITAHSLTRLSQTEVKTMIRDVLGGGSIPQQLVDQIIEKADGVPLFIEELTSTTLSAPFRSRGTFERTAQPASLRVPETLSDALMERLDRVAPSRRVAQIAAVIGREFSHDLLSAASRIDADDMQSALSLLEQADIIYRVGISPFVRFAFKHVLLRDAIYDTLLRSKKQQIHADIAAILENDFPELVENQPEILAYHYQEAGNHQLAIRCWFDSGQRAHFARGGALRRPKILQRVLSNTAVFDTLWRDLGQPSEKEGSVYAAIRQGKAKTGMAEELTRRIKEGAIPIISDVPGFMAYYVVYAPDDTVTAISIFNDYAGAEESNRRALTWIEQNLAPLLSGPATALAGPVIVHTLA
jgi:hypothetical protein